RAGRGPSAAATASPCCWSVCWSSPCSSSACTTSGRPMSEQTDRPARAGHATGTGFGRVIVFVYGILAFAATGRASFELVSKFADAPLPYGLSVLAALVYIVATWALATDRRQV